MKPNPRQPTEIQSEYARICSVAGDINYKIKKLGLDLERAQSELNRLDQEYLEATRVPPENTTLEWDQKPEETKTP